MSARLKFPTHMKRHPIIALLTDFGSSDGYVASMKGVILSIAPHASLIDITHDLPPQDVRHAGYVVWSCYRTFPQGTIFVCVVDPGVGTKRKILCASIGGYYFLAPDNGLLKYVLSSESSFKSVDVVNKKYFAKNISTTFHGRDIFAPAAAHLANGIPMKNFGPAIRVAQSKKLFIRIDDSSKSRVNGEILHIDRFGNIITNCLAKSLPKSPKSIALRIGNRRITEQSLTYEAAGKGKLFITLGSSGLIEMSLKNGSAAKRLSAIRGQQVQFQLEHHA